MNARNTSPTTRSYSDLEKAYDHFNLRLFDNKLPPCLITLQRHKGAYGYFSGERFASMDGAEITDEIAMNPATFEGRTPLEILSTLAHEMAHLWRHRCSEKKPPRGGYHDIVWVEVMIEIGLIPQAVNGPVGKGTGDKVSHRIEPGGRFEREAKRFLERNTLGLYSDRAGDQETRKKKAASKTRYTCPACEQNAWAKPDANLKCGDCDETMETIE
jgi:predicted SprT family Zn-dependent metalloprotease